jgi:heptosyltransferase-3
MPESVVHGPTPYRSARDNDTGKTADETARRILVYRIGSIGDTIIALPSLWAIRRSFPGSHIALLGNAHEKESYVLARGVLPAEGLIDEWLTYPTGHGRTRPSMETLGLLQRLRVGKYDTLVYLAPRGRKRTHVLRDLGFFYAAGVRHFIGHRGIDLLPARVFGEPQQVLEHEADHLLRRLALSGIDVPVAGEGRMDLGITAGEESWTDAWLAEQSGEALSLNRLVGISPGSNWQSKMWPGERYARLGRRIIDELGLMPLLLGGPEDIERNDELIGTWGAGVNAAGLLSVRHAAAALARCRMYVGNDTGTMHMAAAVGTPCVVAFSAQDWPGRWYPYGAGHTILRRAVPCAGCMLRDCDRELQCLNEIEVDDVFDACRRMLGRQDDASEAGARGMWHEV